ncbi:uncharacterized protein F5891DRAFT_1244665 [Suillus fuscotomentosus]|uniref:C2H2-type domain-containing protein n=1 Tax=Suillus fuscotomentosus TaxID=1912939 RepID=A0AAD4EHK8_9AGAM|nr:uncharacterized protein F5891DRAFT_1244665 [Suillus fuscotomentosus]KAG1906369.1 hypothetical protein F5891DRAFT_1244665 [Suillus fuscotomentosus]
MPKTYTCSICNQAFPKFADCKAHEAMHSPENAYFCTWEGCNFVTLHKASFHYHTDVHTGEQCFVCPHDGCDYRTHTSSNITQHRKKEHGRRGPSATNSSGAPSSSQPPPPAEPLPFGTLHQYQYQLQPMQPQPMQSYPTQYQPQSTQYQPPPPIHNQSLDVLYGPAGRALPSLRYLRRQVRLTLKGKRVQQRSRGMREKAQVLSSAPKRSHAEPKRYRVDGIICNERNRNICTREHGGQWMDASGWLALKGAQAWESVRAYTSRSAGMVRAWRALRGKAAHHIGITVDSTQSDAMSSCYALLSENYHITP